MIMGNSLRAVVNNDTMLSISVVTFLAVWSGAVVTSFGLSALIRYYVPIVMERDYIKRRCMNWSCNSDDLVHHSRCPLKTLTGVNVMHSTGRHIKDRSIAEDITSVTGEPTVISID